MPAVQLIFDLPEDKEESQRALDGSKYHSAIWDFTEKLRRHRKDDHTEGERDMLEKIWDELWQILNYEGIADQFE